MDSVFLRVARNPVAFPEAAKTVRRLKKIAASWDQEPEDISDEEAFRILLKKTWVNLQFLSEPELTDISPLADFPQLTGLCLWNNKITSVSVLEKHTELKSLGLTNNLIGDLNPIRGMQTLKELQLKGNPVGDFSVLMNLPALEELEISSDQLDAFSSAGTLTAVRNLSIHERISGSMQRLPELPNLRALDLDGCSSLEGIERFVELQNLNIGSGEVCDLSPISSLTKLTHLHIGHNQIEDLSPLGKLYALRDLWAGHNRIRSIEPLIRLPLLHGAVVKENLLNKEQLRMLEEHLTSWDDEFADPDGRFEPDLAIEIVDEETWEYYDKYPFGLNESDLNGEMLASEKSWLIDRIETALLVDWKKDEDIYIPWQSSRGRSHTVVLTSDASASSLRQVATAIQRELCYARNEFIIYLQTDISVDKSLDFIVWVYRNKIVATPKTAVVIEKLLCQ